MRINHIVQHIQQPSAMSCWWTCFRMLRVYCGYSDVRHPRFFSPAFERPFSRPRGFSLDIDYSHTGPDLDRSHLIVAPYEWYDNGIPTIGTHNHLVVFCELTGMRYFEARPAFGSWQPNDFFSRLRSNGPIMFFGFWNGAPHVILITGIDDESSGPTPSGTRPTMILYNDPALPYPFQREIGEFNTLMANMSVSPYNPLYMPLASGAGYRLQ